MLKDKERHLFGYKRWNHVGGVVVVLANLNDSPAGDVTIDQAGLEDGKWHEHSFNFDLDIQNGTLKTSLGPSEVKILLSSSRATFIGRSEILPYKPHSFANSRLKSSETMLADLSSSGSVVFAVKSVDV